MSKNRFFAPRRLALDGIMTALFLVLSLFSIEILGVKVTFASLPVVLCAILFGPVDAMIVGLLGAFLEQMIQYGFTATTLLWVLPPAIRGLSLGLLLLPVRKRMPLTHGKGLIYCNIFAILASFLTSIANTLVFYVDASLYGYYRYELVFGVFWWRILTGVLVAVVCCIVAIPVVNALLKSGLIRKKEG